MRLIFILALFLAGCAPTIREGAPLLNKVSPQKADSNPAVKPVTELPEMWWKAFNDPDLDRLVDLAMQGNPALDEARDRLEEAQARTDESGASLYPHVDSVSSFRRQRLSRNGNNDIYNGKTATIANVFPLFVNYNLDLWNRNGEIVSAASASEKATRAKYRQSALMLSSAVIKTYFALSTAKNLAAIQAEIVRLSEEKTDLLDSAYRAGIRPKNIPVSARADLRKSKAVLAALHQRKETLNFALVELLGKTSEEEIRTASTGIPERFGIPGRIDLDLLSKRPDVQAALWNVRRAAHLEKAAKAAFYPNINLFALTGFNSIGISDLLGPGGATYAYGPAIDLPLFEGGALEGRLHEREAAYDEAVHAYNRILLAAVRQIADALSAMRYGRQKLDERTASVDLRNSETSIARSGFQSGVSGKLPYLEAEIRLNKEKMAQMEESLNWLYSITDAATALGGGFGRWPS